MNDVVILTDHRYENPKTIDWYIQQVLTEDNLLKKELELLGHNTLIKDWKSIESNCNKTKVAIFRSTWDYFDNFNLFINWLEKSKSNIRFINSYNLIKWNLDKTYLFDLNKRGINIPPTLLVRRKEKISLKELFSKTKWKEAIIKPTVSGAARHTYRINCDNFLNYESLFTDLINEEDFLFQEFMKDITINGEISLVLISGKFTHAVKKIAKEGDFRVQDDHGGKVEIYYPNDDEIRFAEETLKCCDELPIYARVDFIYDNNSKISLVELELIEPELWFRNNPNSAKILAEEINKII